MSDYIDHRLQCGCTRRLYDDGTDTTAAHCPKHTTALRASGAWRLSGFFTEARRAAGACDYCDDYDGGECRIFGASRHSGSMP